MKQTDSKSLATLKSRRCCWWDGMEPYYPVNDSNSTALYLKYKALADIEPNVIFGGRLAEYKYYDMAPIIDKIFSMEI